jgi:hypothetical protein
VHKDPGPTHGIEDGDAKISIYSWVLKDMTECSATWSYKIAELLIKNVSFLIAPAYVSGQIPKPEYGSFTDGLGHYTLHLASRHC